MKTLDFLIKDDAVIEWEMTGSRIICNPPPTNTDLDFIVLCNYIDNWILCNDYGFIPDGSANYPPISNGDFGFNSYRDGDYNLILTTNEYFYKAFVQATEEAAKLNLLNKEDRVALFQKIRDEWEQKYKEKWAEKRKAWNICLDNNGRIRPKWEMLNRYYGNE